MRRSLAFEMPPSAGSAVMHTDGFQLTHTDRFLIGVGATMRSDSGASCGLASAPRSEFRPYFPRSTVLRGRPLSRPPAPHRGTESVRMSPLKAEQRSDSHRATLLEFAMDRQRLAHFFRSARPALEASAALSNARRSTYFLPITLAESPRRLTPALARRSATR